MSGAGSPTLTGTPLHGVGVVGLGRMGLPMARHLVAAGFATWGCDFDGERRAALVSAGGREAATPAAAAGATDATLVMVPDEAQVRAAVFGPDGVVAGVRPDHILIIGSTIGPDASARIASDARGRLGVLDAPVCRGQRGAEAGTLTVLVGGNRALFERCRPLFEAFGEHVFHVGEAVGAGQTAKLANNLMLWTGVVGAHAALTLARHLGLSPVRLRAALQASSADSWALRELDRIQLTWPEKDLAQIAAAIDAAALTLPIVGPVREAIRRLTREDLRRLCSEADVPSTDQT